MLAWVRRKHEHTWRARAQPCSLAGLPGGLHGAALRWAAIGGALRGGMQQHGHQVDAAQGCQVRLPSRTALQSVRAPGRRQLARARRQLRLADLWMSAQPSAATNAVLQHKPGDCRWYIP